MRKIIEANNKDDIDNRAKAVTGLAALTLLDKSAKKRSRQKLMNDIMYYLRKLLNLAKQVQNLSESKGDDILTKQSADFDKIKKKIDELEAELGKGSE